MALSPSALAAGALPYRDLSAPCASWSRTDRVGAVLPAVELWERAGCGNASTVAATRMKSPCANRELLNMEFLSICRRENRAAKLAVHRRCSNWALVQWASSEQRTTIRETKGSPMQLQGKSAMVTGAASGIGKEIAFTYAREGANVAIADLDRKAAEAAAAEIKAGGGKAIGVAMDVADEEAVNAGIAAVVRAFGGI